MKNPVKMKKSINKIASTTLGIFCFVGGGLFAQASSDAVYEQPSSNTAKFYNEMAGTNASNSFTLGEPVYVQFLFTEKPSIPSDEHVRASVSSNGITFAIQDFKPGDEVLAIYFAETYSLDLNVLATSASFKDIKGLTEATLTDRKLSIMTYFIEGLFRDMLITASGKLIEGNYNMKVALESGKEVWDATQGKQVFNASKTFSSGEFSLKVTKDQIESYRKDMLTNFGEVILRNFARVTDDGIKGDAHKQNLNKIVFSNTAITDNASSSSFKTSFGGLSEGIYSRVYLPLSIHNISANLGVSAMVNSYSVSYYLDGKYISSLWLEPTAELLKSRTSWEIGVAPINVTEENMPEVYNFAKALVKASAGKHTFKAVISINYLNTWNANIAESQQLAAGEFELNVTEADKTNLLKKLCPKFSWINNNFQLVPNAFSMIDGEKRADEKVLKVVLYDNDWTYQRNFWGVILSRLIRGKGIVQNTKTGLCFEIDITFYQENISSGGSSYSSTTFQRWGEYDSSVWFSEECIKK